MAYCHPQICYIFKKKKHSRIHSFFHHHEHRACTLGTCPSMGSGEWVNAFCKAVGLLKSEPPSSPSPQAPVEPTALEKWPP